MSAPTAGPRSPARTAVAATASDVRSTPPQVSTARAARLRLRALLRRPRRVVLWCAVLTGTARLAGALWPIRPDEAGFTLVARAWDPGPARLYGPYWVDRPPLLIGLVRFSDWLGGPLFVRFLGAVGCAIMVVAAAGVAREVASLVGASEPRARRTVALTAVGTAALTSNAMIDLVAAKGEVLGLPFLVGGLWLALRARAVVHRTGASTALAFAAGLAGAVALGLKQNQVGSLAFAGVFLLVELLTRRLRPTHFLRLGSALTAGFAVPVLATAAWAVGSGVGLRPLWYAVYGFRSDAVQVIWSQPGAAPHRRALELAGIFVASGMLLLFGWLLARGPGLVRRAPSLTLATLAVLGIDLTGLVMGGSYWRPYLFGLVPSAVLALALVGSLPSSSARRLPRRALELCVTALTGSALVASTGWLTVWVLGVVPPTEFYTGESIRRASAPGDTLVVFGGRADLQLASGLGSPYPYLWSLPARTLDPGSQRLSRLLAGPGAPTWFVEWVPLDAWDPRSEANLRRVLDRRYVVHGNACNDRPVYLLRGLQRPSLHLGCGRPYRPRRPGDSGLGPQSAQAP